MFVAAEADPFLRLPYQFVRREWLLEDRPVRDELGHVEVALKLGLVQIERGSDAVESVGRAVGRKQVADRVRHADVERQQVDDGVRVFVSVQPPQQNLPPGHPALLLNSPNLAADPFRHGKAFRGRWSRLVLRRHRAKVNGIHHLSPAARKTGLTEVGLQPFK